MAHESQLEKDGFNGWLRPTHGRLTRPDPEFQRGGRLPETEMTEDLKSLSFSQRIEHFTWAWFTLPMSTGGIALLLAVQPHTFDGLITIGKVVFIFDLVIFCTLTALMVTRFVKYPYKFKSSLTNPTESLFVPTYLLCLATIITSMQHYGVPSTGVWLIVTVRVLFWIYVPVSFLLAVIQYYHLFTGAYLTIQSMTPAWLLPVFPIMLAGTIASTIAPDQTPTQRMAILVAGATFQGLGFWTAILMYSIYIGRMMESGLPGPNLRPGMFIAVGPPSFTGLAVIGMANAVPRDYSYFMLHPTAINTIQQIALAFAIFIWSLAFWFFCVSLLSCLVTIRQMSFHLIWWAFIFPNTGFTIAIITIGEQLESSAIGWVASGMSCIIIVLYLTVLFNHARAVWSHEILWPGKDEDKDD